LSTLLRHAILLLGIIPLVTCTHEKDIPVDCGDAQTIAEMKEWVFFKTGTYWIYEEQNTGALDTVTVIAHSEDVSAGGFETFGTLMHSSFDAYNYDYWLNDSYSGPSNDGCNSRRIFCTKSKPGNYFGGSYVFIFPLKEGRQGALQTTINSDGAFSISSYPYNYIVDNNSFPFCVAFYNPLSVQHNWTESTYTIAKETGIVRKDLHELDQIWSVIEFNIIH
jgi:hypothetical protein